MIDFRCCRFLPVAESIQPPSTGTLTEVTLVQRDPNKLRFIVGASLVRDGGAGTSTIIFELAPSTISPKIRWADCVLAAGPQSFSWDDLTNLPAWLIPPDWALILTWPATAAGETLRLRYIVAEVLPFAR